MGVEWPSNNAPSHNTTVGLQLLPQTLLAAVLATLCTTAAADAFDRAKQRGKLIAGIHYVVPEYKGGMKFRTPEAIDTALLEDLAQRLQLPLTTVRTELNKPPRTLPSPAGGRGAGGEGDRKSEKSKPDITLVTLTSNVLPHRTATIIPTGYTAGPMAIMRTDTDIKTWEHLKGRKVCFAEGGHYVGTLAAKYGATELVYKAPADALIAVRTGECDATVHDSTMLEELIKYPEWKKFSARLPVGPRTTLVFVVPAEDKKSAAFLKQVANDWVANGTLDQLMKKAVRNIAFEVYLDQNVPDCH